MSGFKFHTTLLLKCGCPQDVWSYMHAVAIVKRFKHQFNNSIIMHRNLELRKAGHLAFLGRLTSGEAYVVLSSFEVES